MDKLSASKNNAALRSMFREIIRGLRKIRNKLPILQKADNSSTEFKKEVEKAAIDRIQYRDYLLSEIRHTLIQKFSSKPKNIKDHAWHTRLWHGHNLAQTLNEIHSHPTQPRAWSNLVKIVLEERQSQFQKNKWTLDYRAHKKEIDESHMKEMTPLQAKQLLSRQAKKPEKASFKTDKDYRKALKESEENAQWVVRNYLKRLQLSGKIPNPYKLPYVSENMHEKALELPKLHNVLPGSTKAAVMETAYNMTYIECILKPEIEYLLNKRHYLDKYQEIVNTKGPTKVQVRKTLAGIMQAHFIRSPLKDEKRLEELAIDVKRLTRAIRKQFVWNLGLSQSEHLTERKIGEGYAVRGSRGYSMDEVMHTRAYLENLVSQEAEWEYSMKIEELKAKYGPNALQDNRITSQLDKLRQQMKQGWFEPLDIASKDIDDEVELFFVKYKIADTSPIWERRDALQTRMDERYEKTSQKLGKLIKLLERDQVHAHSDLFHPSTSKGSATVREMPERGRIGTGKSLGDYLEEVGLNGYKMGYKFRKKLNIA